MKKTRFFNKYHLILTLTLVSCSLFLSTCQDPDTSWYEPVPAGKGSITLIVDGTDARTISPNPASVSIAAYTIEFLEPGTSTVLETYNRTSITPSDPFYLVPGTYDIQVTAYIDAARTKAVAQGGIKNVTISEGTNEPQTVTLSFIITPSGTGTFKWNISVPEGLSSSSMTITPLNPATGTTEEPIPFTGTSFTGDRPLNTGYYQITFKLKKDANTQEIVFREFLHVYNNLDSSFSKVFTDEYFNNIKYTVTFVFDNGTLNIPQDLLHGQTATDRTPAEAKPTPAGLYMNTPPPNCTFDGWYNGDTQWNFAAPVIGNMTLTAHWTAARLVEDVTANNVAAAISYVNSSPGAYTLLMGDNASFSSATTPLNTSGSALTITGQSAMVTITNSATLAVTNSAALTIGKNIAFSGNGDLIIYTGSSITLSDNAVINSLTLNSTSSGNSSVTINSGWTGSVASLNLHGSDSNLNNVIGFWYNQAIPKIVLEGTVSAETVAKFTLGKFITMSGTSQSISAAMPGAPYGYAISDDGKLVAINPAARIVSTGIVYQTLYAAIDAAPTGTSFSNPTEIVILRDITAPEAEMSTNTGYTIPINKNIKLNVEAGNDITITAAAGGFRLFTSSTNSSLTLGPTASDGTLTLSGGNANTASNRQGVSVSGSGRLILNDGVTITGFNNTGSGGGVNVSSGGTFNMNGGTISGNTASGASGSGQGGGVYVYGTFTMSGGTISDNTSSSTGGGVHVANGTFTMSGGEISGNTASSSGGGVYWASDDSTFIMNSGKITKNTANTSGGGVYVLRGAFNMSGNSEISYNKTNDSTGGGVYGGNNCTITMGGGTISGNTSSSNGGGVYLSGAFTMSGGTIGGNTASSGGGVYVSGTNSNFTMSGGTIYGSSAGGLANTASSGASLYKSSSSTATFSGDYGGGKYTIDDTIATTNNTLPGQPRPITSSTGIELVLIPAGTFMMGSPTDEPNRNNDETQHSVTLTQGFYMGKYLVTQEQWVAVMYSNPSSFSSNPQTGETQSKRPVETVSWYDVLVFCNKLSVMDGLSPAYSINGSTDLADWGSVPTSSDTAWDNVVIVAGSTGYRLPTEAQWEYACRAGTTTAYNTGGTINTDTGWYATNSGDKTHQVGLKPANNWGLYDMHGNVRELCWDWRTGDYPSGTQTDPTGTVNGADRVVRSGDYSSYGPTMRSAYRYSISPYSRSYMVGFRIVRP